MNQTVRNSVWRWTDGQSTSAGVELPSQLKIDHQASCVQEICVSESNT